MIRRTSTWILSLALALALIACGGKDEENGGSAGSGGAAGLSQYGGETSPGAMYALAGAASVETAAPDDLSRLCPDGPVAFIRIRNLDELVSEAGAIASSFGESIPPVREFLGQNLGIPGLKGVDLSRPIGVALFVDSKMAPSPILFFPLSSKSDFEGALAQGAGSQVATAFLGDWVALAQDPSLVEGLELRKAPSSLAARALMGDVAISVDVKALYAMFGKQVDDLAGDMEPPPGELPPGAGEMLTTMRDTAMGFLSDADFATIALGLKDGSLTFGFRYGAKPGSPTAKLLTENPQAAQLLSRIGTSGFLSFAMNMNGEKMWSMIGPAFESLRGQFPPEVLDGMSEMMKLVQGQAAVIGFQDGFTWTQIGALKDAERYEAIIDSMMPRMKEMVGTALEEQGMPPGMLDISLKEGFDHDGVSVKGMTYTLNLPEDPSQAEVREMMDYLLGGTSLDYYYARVGDRFVATIGAGAKQRMTDLIETMKAGGDGPAGAAFDRATAGFPDQPSSLFFLDLGQIAKIVSKIPTEEMPPMIRQMLSRPPENLWMAGYARAADGQMDAGFRMSLKDLIEYVMPLVQDR